MTKLLLLYILLLGHLAHGQDKYPTMKQLQNTLTKKTKLKGHIYNSTNWFTLESDSSYQNADTLVFYNNSMYQYGKLICNLVDWNFYKKEAFWVQRLQLCKEPTTAAAIKDEYFFTFKIIDGQQPMIFQVFNKEEMVDQFEVLSLVKQPMNNQYKETIDVLTLRRMKFGPTKTACSQQKYLYYQGGTMKLQQ
jgi:hypothetical protein